MRNTFEALVEAGKVCSLGEVIINMSEKIIDV
jgi:hypothetical protein